MADVKEMTRVQAIKEFFYRPGIDTTQSFMNEVKQLSPAERQELATLVAEKMGVTIKE